MTTETSHSDAQTATARSVVYDFLASMLSYPEPETFRSVATSSSCFELDLLLQQTFADLADHLRVVRAELRQFLTADDESAALRNTYTELFGHAVRGTCPPYELEYGNADILQQASELADIAGFYQAFGMDLPAESHERQDHIAVECEFMAVLAAKEAYAIESDNDEAQQVVCGAQQSFLADHLCRWSPACAHRLRNANPDGLYGKVATVLDQFIKAEAERFDVSCGPELLELRPIDAQRDATIQCGVEESCPGSSAASENVQSLVQIRIDR